MQMAQQINGNASLLFNIIDQAAGSTHLIGARSRAAIARPFTMIKEMEAEANKRVGTKIEEFQKQAEEAQKKLGDLQSKKAAGSELYLSPEQEAEIRKLRKQEVDAPSSSANRRRTSSGTRTSSPATRCSPTSPSCRWS